MEVDVTTVSSISSQESKDNDEESSKLESNGHDITLGFERK